MSGSGRTAPRLALRDFALAALKPIGLKPAAHHRMLLTKLNWVSETPGARLLVQMPPGSAKSTYGSMLFPAWWFARHPRSSVIAVAHTRELAWHFGRGVRRWAEEHDERLGYGFDRDNRAAHRFRTTLGGEYFATGIGGGITGRRADLVVIDDPIKSHAEADSAAHREFVWDWYRSELIPRLKPGGRIVLIMTRWHLDDLGGRLDGAEGWERLVLPAIDASGAAVWPAWEPLAALEKKRAVVGERVWQALYQQTPVADGGALFHVGRIDTVDAAPSGLRCVRAWDLAATEAGRGRDPDWTVGMKLGADDAGRVFVLDVMRMQAGPHEVAEAVVHAAHADGRGVAVGLPQDPGQAGKQQVAWLAGRLAGHRVVASPETGAKLTRAGPVAAQADAGNLIMVRGGWNRALLDELRDFPTGRKDDQVDALARGFAMLTSASVPGRRVFVPIMGR